jgi:hypothetical protein
VGIHPVRFRTADGLWLEGRICVPEKAQGAAVLCHPYPPAGGSMSSILIPLLQRALDARGWASLRFNFRGVGQSEGRFESGAGEERDAVAALDFLANEAGTHDLAVIGWSFGAMVGARAAPKDARVEAYVAVAPPVSAPSLDYVEPLPERLEGWRARVLGVCGTADQYCTPEDMRAWLKSLSPDAEARVVDGADHFFTNHRDELVEIVVSFVTS